MSIEVSAIIKRAVGIVLFVPAERVQRAGRPDRSDRVERRSKRARADIRPSMVYIAALVFSKLMEGSDPPPNWTTGRTESDPVP